MKKVQGKINHKKVLEGILAGKKKIEIAPEAGSLAKSDEAKVNAINQVINSSEFQKEAKPILDRMRKESDRILTEMSIKDLSEVEYKDLSASFERFKKLEQLLSGSPTENNEITIKWS